MKIFKLTPKSSNGYVRIRAISEERARQIAENAFGETNVNKVIHSVEWAAVVWKDKGSVDCVLEDEDNISNEEGILDIV